MAFPETIETERLVLRGYAFEYLDALVDAMGNWEVTKWLSTNVPFPYGREDGEKFITESIAKFEEGSSIRYAAIDKHTDRLVGGIGVFSVTEETEIGYWMHPDFWGKGLGTEILDAVIDTGFKDGIIRCFIAQTNAKNRGSQRILEKVGFQNAGAPPPEYARGGHMEGPSECFRLSLEEWTMQQQEKVT